jgi:hypothetical protein
VLIAYLGMPLREAERVIATHQDEHGRVIPEIKRFDCYWWLQWLHTVRRQEPDIADGASVSSGAPRPPAPPQPPQPPGRPGDSPAASAEAPPFPGAPPVATAGPTASASTTPGAAPGIVAFQMDVRWLLFLLLFV